ncbi:hypothetical protein [Dactylosporangium sp. CA-233914]|uniref:hypothetical protein n=1 Tax=Dactylosporangium sp. CA-233914 TaxID=3239934 RepID=UPI003D8FFCC3
MQPLDPDAALRLFSTRMFERTGRPISPRTGRTRSDPGGVTAVHRFSSRDPECGLKLEA